MYKTIQHLFFNIYDKFAFTALLQDNFAKLSHATRLHSLIESDTLDNLFVRGSS